MQPKYVRQLNFRQIYDLMHGKGLDMDSEGFGKDWERVGKLIEKPGATYQNLSSSGTAIVQACDSKEHSSWQWLICFTWFGT